MSQVLNAHPELTIFDEVNLLDVARLWERLNDPTQQAALDGLPLPDSEFYQALMRADSPTQFLTEILFGCDATARRWGEKFPAYVNVREELSRLFPGHYMLFVVRDPRAIIASMLRYRNTAERTADDFWIADDASAAVAMLNRSAEEYKRAKDEVITIRYEALVADPAAEIRKMCAAVDLPFSDEMLHPQPGPLPGSALTSQFVRNGVALPWKSSNRSEVSGEIADKWRGELDDAFWSSISNDLEPIMCAFGYVV